MKTHHLTRAIALSFLTLCAQNSPAQKTDAPVSTTLFDFRKSEKDGHLTLNVPKNQGASVTLQPPDKKWDIGDYTRLELEVANAGTQKMQIRVRAMNEGATDWGNSAINTGFLAPGERKFFPCFSPANTMCASNIPH